MHYVKGASYAGGHRLRIRFEDGKVKVVDLGPHLDGPIFEPLKQVSYFRSFKVNRDIDTIAWPNDADFSPDFLYSIGRDAQKPAAARRRGKPEAPAKRRRASAFATATHAPRD